jgi:dihydrodiol dehydrogenase / D-xylose 1-dehydrogenase (NADP)
MDKIRWGIISTGWIANRFVEGLSVVEDVEAVAVGSRTQASADSFADKWHIPHRHGSYESLVNDPDVDVVYIGTPHPFHYENTLLCLNAGKHVLVEKPFAMNAHQAKEMIRLAQDKGLFLMEAMWTRYIPAMVQVRQWLAEGAIGDVELVRASFSFKGDFPPTHRLLNPQLGGGALLDAGIYPISLAYMVLGSPRTINSTACFGETGIDIWSAYMLGYDNGKTALLSSGVQLSVPVEAEIIGTKGYIKIHEPWLNPRVVTLAQVPSDVGGNVFNTQTVHVPTVENGYNYEVIEVGKCLRAGQLESAVMPLDETLDIMTTLDTIREQWGLTYPVE